MIFDKLSPFSKKKICEFQSFFKGLFVHLIKIRKGMRGFILFIFSFVGGAAEKFAEHDPEDEEKADELIVRESFPQYRVFFDSQKVHEDVYKEFLKENQKSPDQKNSLPKP